MEITVLKKQNDKSVLSSILLFILGLFLTFNSEGILNIIFDIIGAIVIIYGIYQFIKYYSQKKQFGTDDGTTLISAISAITIGLLVIFLSNVFTNAIKIVTGIWLIYVGLTKLGTAITLKKTRAFMPSLISAIIIFLLGIYTLVAQNVLFVVIGVILMIYSILDIISFLRTKR